MFFFIIKQIRFLAFLMSVNSIQIILIFVLSLASINISASLKDKYKEQQKPKKVVIPQEVLDIRDDINNSWDAIIKNGTFYFLMKAGNVGKYSDGRIWYKTYITDVFPFALVDNKIFIPLLEPVGKGNYWKGQKISCEKPTSFVRPAPVGRLDKNRIANFKSSYLYSLTSTRYLMDKSGEFEVNFDTKECFASIRGGPVQKCKIVAFDEVKKNLHFKDAINKKRTYLKKKDFESCKVTK